MKNLFLSNFGGLILRLAQKSRKNLLFSLGIVVVGAVSLAHADTLPSWTRGAAGTTYQVWDFVTNKVNSPDGPWTNAYGTPQAIIITNGTGVKWYNTNASYSTNRGLWVLNKSSMKFTIPVLAANRPQTNQVQITCLIGGGLSAAPSLVVSNGTQPILVSSIAGAPANFGLQWFTNLYSCVIQPATSSETILVVGDQSLGSIIDQVIVDTKQLPLPVAAPMTVYRTPGYTSKILLADVATNWTNQAGYSVSLAGVNPSTNGVNLSYNSTYIFYPSTNSMLDQFTYTITDGQGGSNTGIVTLALQTPATVQTPNILGLTVNGDSSVTIQFVGIPNYTYKVQATTNLVSPAWQVIGSGQAGTNGLWQFTDTDASLYPMRYYRTQYP
jgi:hypothetical protein